MKKLSDLSVFRWKTLPRPGECWGMEFFLHPARRSYRMRQLFFHPADTLLRIENICEVDTLPGAHYLRRHSPVLSLEYVRSGSLLVRQQDRAYELDGGELFLMQPGCESEFLCGARGCRKMSLLFSGSLLAAFLERSGLGRRDVMKHPEPARFERLFQEVGELSEVRSPGPGENTLLAFRTLHSLLLPPEPEGIPAPLGRLLEQLEHHPERPWSQAGMAQDCGCSPTHLVRLFRKHLQTTPRRYLNELRMKLAHQCLVDERLSVKEIAARCGFHDAMNFSTGFRKRFGSSPSAYRRQLSSFGSDPEDPDRTPPA